MEISPLFDRSDPQSLYNLLPTFMQAAIEGVDEADLDKTEAELAGELFPDAKPDRGMYQLRIAFWDEFDRAGRLKLDVMDSYRIYDGVCSMNRFKSLINDPLKLAWLLHPPMSYTLVLREISEMALHRQLEAMCLPIKDDKGRVNVKLIEAQLKIFQHLDTRLRGGFVQKTENKNLTVTVDGGKQLPAGTKQLSFAEIEEELLKLRKMSEALMAPANVKLDARKMITGEIMEAEVVSESPAVTQPEKQDDRI